MNRQKKINGRLLLAANVILITIGVLFASHAIAQTAEQILLLQNNPSLLQQFQDRIGVQQGNTQINRNGVPSSSTTEILNSQDIISDQSLLTQSIALEPDSESVIQRYYSILTGDVLPVYGAAEFGQSQDEQLLFFNTMGKEYRLAAGDVVRVTLRGLTESDSSYKIGRDGNLIMPSLAPLFVSGLTIAQAERKLLNDLQYDDASAAVYISLETARLITVQVSGSVKTPRTIAVPAYTPLSRVLAYTGGIKPTGSLRNIILRDRDGGTQKVDFYDFLQSPIGSNDPLVTDSSRVFVGNQGSTIAATGFVARPGIYELPTGTTEISVRELLELTGTTILPPGMEMEALYFDGAGITSKSKVSIDSQIKSGEVLDLRFVSTNLQRSIQVVGAVLDEYEMAGTSAIVLNDLLKNGAVLKKDAFIDFALLISKSGSPTAFSIREKLFDPDFLVPVDSVLVVFDTPQFKKVVSANPNTSIDPLVSTLTQTEVAELYLNGEKIAFVAPSSANDFAGLLRPFYRITPSTSLKLAIIESKDGSAKSVSLRKLLSASEAFSIKAGEKIHLFETDFLGLVASGLNNIAAGGQNNVAAGGLNNVAAGNPNNQEIIFSLNNSGRLLDLFARAGVVVVKIDQQVRSFLPASEAVKIETAFDFIGLDDFTGFSDKVILTNRGTGLRSSSTLLSLNDDLSSKLPNSLIEISFFSDSGNQAFLKNRDDTQFDKIVALGVSLYIDYELFDIIKPNDLLAKDSSTFKRITDAQTYPLFAIYEEFDRLEGFWSTRSINISELTSPSFVSEMGAGARVSVFTRKYLSELVNSESGSDANNQSLILQASGLNVETNSDEQFNREDFLKSIEEKSFNQVNPDETFTLQKNINLILSSSRFIGGAVEKPGYYPISGSVTLRKFLATAGGLTKYADTTNIKLTTEKVVDGTIVLDQIISVDLSKIEASTINLSGRYSIDVTPLANDNSAGLVKLEGEVKRPGEYLISRDDTLHDLIKRAGGLTDVAYPLGAVFTRESLKSQQRDSNAILARQLEQAVVQVSQSNNQDVAEQIQAVLGYARQLRLQDVTGRMSINVVLEDDSSPIYLQSGDVLKIPKRPAHVTVIGSVQKDTVVSYSPDKRMSDYLSSAGGLNRIADLKQTYILLPNGESIIANNESIVPPGAVIVVPPKTDRLSVLGLTDLVSRVLGNIATSVLAINNVR